MNEDIECKACGRITFAWERNRRCPSCGLLIRPIMLDAPVFGFDVAIKVRDGSWNTMIVKKHFWTNSEKTARRRAKYTPYFIEVVAVEPLTEKEWLGAYGDPRDKSKFS